jgi:hypothetical protein
MKKYAIMDIIHMHYYNEKTFKPELVYITDEHFQIAKNIHEIYSKELKLNVSPIMVANDKKSLLICVNMEHKEDVDYRVKRECNEYLYKITIEPPKLREPELSADEKALKEIWRCKSLD